MWKKQSSSQSTIMDKQLKRSTTALSVTALRVRCGHNVVAHYSFYVPAVLCN